MSGADGGERARWVRSVGVVSTLGITLVASTLVGFVIGYYLDRWLGTSPWLIIVFLLLGIVSGFVQIFRSLPRLDSMDRDDRGSS
ncbi:MAG TPA: AtpZ/AtpI family protein [Methylomirabilota bacterium]|nr:AtpZ/AtpI family protein [Methylomirabilota bacterium]